MKLHPQVLKKNGRSEFVILSYDEFRALQDRLEDYEDLLELRKAKREDDPNVPGLSLNELKAQLGLAKARSRAPAKKKKARGRR